MLLNETIAHLKDKRGLSYQAIANKLAESGISMSRMAVCQRYLRWKRDGGVGNLERYSAARNAIDEELKTEISAARRHDLYLAAARLSTKINQLERRQARERARLKRG